MRDLGAYGSGKTGGAATDWRGMACGHEVFDNDVWVDCVLFQLDDDGGLIFVDPSILRPYPSEKIEEPKK